jgi:hypothetical protein
MAELARRSPEPGDQEFTADEVAYALAGSRSRAGVLVDLARTLQARLPGTAAALDDGTVSRYKAIAHAVMEAAPGKARERREAAARDARVERWSEDSGNAALMGCELPPDEVLAADQRITGRARELKQAGLEGGMDQLRARAFLDLLLGKDPPPVRRRAQHPLRGRRLDLPLQHRPAMPSRPPPQAAPQMDSRPAPRRHLCWTTGRTAVHDRTHPVPHLAAGHRAVLGMGDIGPSATAALPSVGL